MISSETTAYVRNRWYALATSFTQDMIIVADLYNEIEKAYSQSNRFYHNLDHIARMLRLADEYETVLSDKAVVDYSVFYHDIIYKVPGKNNEHKSALLAVKRLRELKMPERSVEQVRLFIEATKAHQPVEVLNTTDLFYFLDFDMSVLGADWSEYSMYLKNVRKEYKFYPDFLYMPGRVDFLKKTLATEKIFHTSIFRERMEQNARKNMERELSLLTGENRNDTSQPGS